MVRYQLKEIFNLLIENIEGVWRGNGFGEESMAKILL
jgi:hypothetical protein